MSLRLTMNLSPVSQNVYFETSPELPSPIRSQTLSPRIGSDASTIRKSSTEDLLKSLLFANPSPLLNAYCDGLLQQVPVPTHITALMSFFSSRGKLIDLLTVLARREIDGCSANQLFRGNGAFTKIYSSFLSTEGSFLINSTSQKLVEYIIQSGLDKKLESKNNEEVKVIAETLFYSFSSLLQKHFADFSVCHKMVLKSLYMEVSRKRGEIQAKNAFTTLIFLRYLFVPFMRFPNLLKNFQATVSTRLSENTEIGKVIDNMLENIVNVPSLCYSSPIDLKKQEKSLQQIINIIRSEMPKISKKYVGDFDIVFAAVKSKREDSTNIDFAAMELRCWSEGKLESSAKLNAELKAKIESIKKTNQMLRNKMSILRTY
ncbi:hypothetical protein EIN_024030 [Entamoeba invadens IP1]|uniref:hypothetical protein n=1 Tax=Entamoeba invadens IP1 TaxID=370355 RepID=UPI0002C3F7A2|nr:hypothetical protein EIN_024030 [Entamoeba invadens IP1]ELP90694.1 hypothetical protein EIN_024030 [Entamoeba invadens IP1]|eukprot:XP_004257465.1 hypothetical protein EIN_024030 [Entamoeba invadens IP1]